MDFALIKEHPYITGGTVLVGGFLLYVVLHRNSGSSGSGGVQYVGASGPSDAQVAANAATTNAQLSASVQTSQLSASLAGLQIQSDAALRAKAIDASVSFAGIDATHDVTNQQTAAQLALGLGSQQAQVQALGIQAESQNHLLDTLASFFGGGSSTPGIPRTLQPASYTPVGSLPNAPVTGNPNSLPLTSAIQSPIVSSPSSGGTSPMLGPDGWWSNAGNPVYPTYQTTSGFISCSPNDAACVSNNEATANQYHADVAAAQTRNNLQSLVSNYEMSVKGGIATPQQVSEYNYYKNELASIGG